MRQPLRLVSGILVLFYRTQLNVNHSELMLGFTLAELDEIWEVFKTSNPKTKEKQDLKNSIILKVNEMTAKIVGDW